MPAAIRAKGFVEQAQEMGYSPTRLLIERRLEMAAIIAELKECVDKDIGHPALEGKDTTRQLLRQIQEEALDVDLKLLEYEQPKLRAVEANVTGELTYADALRAANAKRAEAMEDDGK